MALRERTIGYNPQNTEVSLSRKNRINNLFPDAQSTIRRGFYVIFGIGDISVDVHGHEGSQATYFTEFNFGDDRFYASFLDAGEKTSKAHKHEWPAGRIPPRTVLGNVVNMAEEYYMLNMDGEVDLHLGRDGVSLPPVKLNKDKLWLNVHSGTSHRVEAIRPSLLIMKTRYGALVDPKDLHIPVEK